jgi:hypothetical protein
MSASADEPQLTCGKCGKRLQGVGRVADLCLACLLELARDEEEPPIALIHLALASVEADPERAAFLRNFDLNRLPESCNYATGLDPAEITGAGGCLIMKKKLRPNPTYCSAHFRRCTMYIAGCMRPMNY